MRTLSGRIAIGVHGSQSVTSIFQNFSLSFPQVVIYLLITFQFFPTLFNILGKLVEKF